MAEDVVALERELEQVTKEIGRVSRDIQKGEEAHARARRPFPLLDKLRQLAQVGPIHRSTKRLLDERDRDQRETQRWIKYERPKLAAELKLWKLKRRRVQSRLRAAQGRGEASRADIARGRAAHTVSVQRFAPKKYRSKVKLVIRRFLLDNPELGRLSVLNLCSLMDGDAVDLPITGNGRMLKRSRRLTATASSVSRSTDWSIR